MFNLMARLWLMSISRKKDIELFWSSSSLPLTHLFGDQIIAILKIIDAELIKSFNFGLKISRDHVIKEKMAILIILNNLGNLGTITRRFSFEEARKIFSELVYHALEDKTKLYFEKLKRKGKVRSQYNCHIESVISAILQSIYNANGKIPYV